MKARSLVLLVLLFGAVSGCSPSLSPLYRDYRLPATTDADTAAVRARIASALVQAGWQIGSPPTPNVVATQPREQRNWGLYRVVVDLEAIPMGQHHVRVLVHPWREYVTGGRSKIPYLSSSLSAAVLPDLNRALKEAGLSLIGTPAEHDRRALKRRKTETNASVHP